MQAAQSRVQLAAHDEQAEKYFLRQLEKKANATRSETKGFNAALGEGWGWQTSNLRGAASNQEAQTMLWNVVRERYSLSHC